MPEINWKKVIYVGLFLEESSKERLLAAFPAVHSSVFAEHVTLAFKPTEAQKAAYTPSHGLRHTFKVVGYAVDAKGQAVVVDGVKGLDDRRLHITISCAADVKPVYSNELLSKGPIITLATSLLITGVYQTHPRT